MAHTLGCELPVSARHCLRRAIAVLLFIGASSANAQNLPGPQPQSRMHEFPGVVIVGTRPGGGSGGGSGGGGNGHGTTVYDPPPWDGDMSNLGPDDPEPVAEHLCDNPVDIVTGRKFEFVEDFAHASLLGMRFQRTYNQGWSGTGLLGKQWVTNHDLKLSDKRWPDSPGEGCYQRPGINPCTVNPGERPIFAHRESGDVVTFAWSATENAWVGSDEEPAARITRKADRGFELAWGDGSREVYDAGGNLTQRLQPDGVGLTYEYEDRQLLKRIRHTTGAEISFTWVQTPWGRNRVIEAIDPAGRIYKFDYELRAGADHEGVRLNSVRFPDGKAALYYHYDDEFRYVGRSVDGARVTTYAYGAESRVTESRKEYGIERTRYAYGDGTITRTNALGKVTTYRIDKGRIVGSTGQASPNCPASATTRTFDAEGRLESETDAAGTVTTFAYDSRGRLARRVEAAGTPVQRAWTFERDAAGRRFRESLEGESEQTYSYTPQGWLQRVTTRNLKAGIVAPDRSVDYSYTQHANGMVASVVEDGPVPGTGDAMTYRYSPSGDLLSITNDAGHATTYSNHTALGLPGRITSPAGELREYWYDPRGRVVVDRTYPNGALVETRYVYGENGLLDTIHTADGNSVLYHYDVAHRLIQEDRTEPEGSFSVRRITYNAMSQPIRIEVGRE
ncbi:DUF6531 domain-containing protein [Noviluteimonas gilva]|nr:DUF6531 domain-containing protein [Lysobacter gilvus]